MTAHFKHGLLAAGASLWSATTLAATLAGAAPADPLDARTPVPAAVHRSALADYQPLRDRPGLAWREANDTVGRIGGWRAYAREAEAAAKARATAATPTGASAPAAGLPTNRPANGAAASPAAPVTAPPTAAPQHRHSHGQH